MKNRSILLSLIIIAIGVYSCSGPAADMNAALDLTKVKSEIQAMEDAYAAGLKAKDAEAVVAYYSEDAVNMPSNEPEAVGKAKILNRLKANMAKDTSNVTEKFEVQEILAGGKYVIEVGKSISTEASGKQTTGKYISIFEKRNGKYVCIRDIWNNDVMNESN